MRLCVVCKKEIEDDRIDAIPGTRLCIEHGREIQKFGGEFKMSAADERTSKQGSMKINYGGIATSSIRNNEAIERLVEEFRTSQTDDNPQIDGQQCD